MLNLPDLSDAKRIAIDLETYDPAIEAGKGTGALKGGHIAGIAVATDTGFAEYYPVNHARNNVPKEPVYAWLREQLSRPYQEKVGANIIYDLEYLAVAGIHVAGRVLDVQIAEPLLDENQWSYSLEAIAQKYLGEGKVENELRTWILTHIPGATEKKWKSHIHNAPGNIVRAYALGDVDLPLKIIERQLQELAKQNLTDLFYMESDLIPMLLAMKLRGVRVDIDKAQEVDHELSTRIAKNQAILGPDINVNAAASLAKLWDRNGLTYPLTEKTKNPSFTKESLAATNHPAARLVESIRKDTKLRDTFVRNAILDQHINGRIHCQFNQLKSDDKGTVSGRFCIAKGQRVMIPGGYKPIEDIKVGDLVYCFDDRLEPTLKKVLWSGKTGTKKVIKLDWISGSRKHRGSLICTPEHRVRISDGSYKEAQHLTYDDSVLAIHRGKGDNGRNKLWATNNPGEKESRVVFKSIHGYLPDHVHHINEDVSDDRPENLEGLTYSEHINRHRSPEEHYAHYANTLKVWPDNGGIPPSLSGKDSPLYRVDLTKERILEVFASEKRLLKAAELLGCYCGTLLSRCAEYGIPHPNPRSKYLSKEELVWYLETYQTWEELIKYCPLKRTAITKLCTEYGIERKKGGNHNITGITKMLSPMDVYDIEVEDSHNFICEELCVHNSSSNPNLQQVPAKGEATELIRQIFVPEPGETWYSIDYSQIEYRVFAHYSGDVELIKAYQDIETDFHSQVGKMLGDTLDRKIVKSCNFLALYGGGPVKLAHGLRTYMSETDADSLIQQLGDVRDPVKFQWRMNYEKKKIPLFEPDLYDLVGYRVLEVYNEKFPSAKALAEKCSNVAKQRGHIFTLLNRRRRFGKGDSTHKALNALCQGSAADIMKKAMVDVWKSGVCVVLGAPLLTVHDELNFSVPDSKLGLEAINETRRLMENAVRLKVPTSCDFEFGPDWGHVK